MKTFSIFHDLKYLGNNIQKLEIVHHNKVNWFISNGWCMTTFAWDFIVILKNPCHKSNGKLEKILKTKTC
jgi:hypothetical protein